MRSLKLTLLFLASSWAFVRAQEECVVPENYCSCYWDETRIQCNVKYNFYNTTSIWVKSPPISGDSCGSFYYKCQLVNNNVRITINACLEWLQDKQDGTGGNTYFCVKIGDIVECGLTITDIENSEFQDVGKCNDPAWYALYDDGDSQTILTAVTVNGVLPGVLDPVEGQLQTDEAILSNIPPEIYAARPNILPEEGAIMPDALLQEEAPLLDAPLQDEAPLLDAEPQEEAPLSDARPQEDAPLSDSLPQEDAPLSDARLQEDAPLSDAPLEEEK